MSKKQWGNATWYLFHTLAEKLKPEYDNPSEIRALYAQIKNICQNLPCEDCKNHATRTLSTVNESVVIRSKAAFIIFLWEFHNKVNAVSGSPQYPFEETKALYSRAATGLIIQNFINVMNIKSSDLKIMMMKTMNKNAYMSSFTEYINKNIHKFT